VKDVFKNRGEILKI